MKKDADSLKGFGEYITGSLPDGIEASSDVINGDVVITTVPKNIQQVLVFLRDDARCQFKQLVDLTAVDYLDRGLRFEVVYNLLSLRYNLRVRVKVSVEEGRLLPTVVGVYSVAGWLEREVWDMYGVYFADHPDLRRILTDYGFTGHPQRKDFPLSGYVQVRYDEEKQRVIYEPVKLDQEFRTFDFESPWEGAKYISIEEKESR